MEPGVGGAKGGVMWRGVRSGCAAWVFGGGDQGGGSGWRRLSAFQSFVDVSSLIRSIPTVITEVTHSAPGYTHTVGAGEHALWTHVLGFYRNVERH